MAGKGTVGQLLVEMRADLGKLRLDVKEMENVFKSSFTNIQASATNFAKSLAGSLGIGLGIGSIVAFGKSVIDLGGKLSDLSASTGISVKALSGIKSTLEENGTSVETFAKGVFKLQAELGNAAKETDPVRVAIGRLGLSYDALTKSSPEEFIKKVTDALAKQENPLTRNALAQGVFKKSAAELIPAVLELAGKFDELKKKGLNEEDAKKLDQFGDALTRMGNAMRIVVAGPLADFIRAFERFFNLTEEGRLKNSLVSISEEIDRLESMLETRKSLKKGIWGFFAGGTEADNKAQEEKLKQKKQQLADVGGELGKLRAGGGTKPTAPFTPPVDTDAIKKATDALNSFLESLAKQGDSLQVSIVQMRDGDQAAKSLGLDLEFAAFKAKLLHDNLKVPADAKTKFDQLKATVLALNAQLVDQKKHVEEIQAVSAAWVKDIDAITAAEEKWAEIKFSPEALGMDDLSKTLDEISKKYMTLIVQMEAAAKAARATPEEIETTTRRLLINRAVEQARARADFTGEGVDPEQEAKDRAMKFGEDLANSMTSGLNNTLMGIETGQQTLAEGMKNLLRNMMLELQGALIDKTVLEPLKAIAGAFIGGFVGALDDAAHKDLKDWAEGLGKQVRSWLGSGLSSIFASISGAAGGSSLGLGDEVNLGFARGGMIPSFASGGLFIGHGGEFVMQKKAVDNIGADTLGMMNKTGKVPGSGTPAVNIEINGDITPRQPNMTPDQVVKVTAGNITNDGMVMSAIEQRLRMRGR